MLSSRPRHRVPEGVIPTSAQVMGPVSDAAAICSGDSIPSISPPPVRVGQGPHQHRVLPQSGSPRFRVVGLGHQMRKHR